MLWIFVGIRAQAKKLTNRPAKSLLPHAPYAEYQCIMERQQDQTIQKKNLNFVPPSIKLRVFSICQLEVQAEGQYFPLLPPTAPRSPNAEENAQILFRSAISPPISFPVETQRAHLATSDSSPDLQIESKDCCLVKSIIRC